MMAAPVATSLKVFIGHGTYDGLTFLVHCLGFLGEQDFYGLIYEGTPPPPLNELLPVLASEDAELTEEPPAE
jgi:hypothetical protein